MNSLAAANVHTGFQFHPKKFSDFSSRGSSKGWLIPRASSTNGKEVSTSATSSSDAATSPFREGKISSRIAAGIAGQQQQQQQEKVQSSTSQRQQQGDNQTLTSTKLSTESPPSKSSSPSSSMRLPPLPPTLPNRGKAFPIGPSVARSPFDSDSLSERGSNSNIDRRILESRKSILDAIWKEKQESSTKEPAPSDIFDDPSPSSSDDKKFQLIYGTNQLLLLLSFALIVGLMVGTAFVVWKLGAIHYNEV